VPGFFPQRIDDVLTSVLPCQPKSSVKKPCGQFGIGGEERLEFLPNSADLTPPFGQQSTGIRLAANGPSARNGRVPEKPSENPAFQGASR